MTYRSDTLKVGCVSVAIVYSVFWYVYNEIRSTCYISNQKFSAADPFMSFQYMQPQKYESSLFNITHSCSIQSITSLLIKVSHHHICTIISFRVWLSTDIGHYYIISLISSNILKGKDLWTVSRVLDDFINTLAYVITKLLFLHVL